MDIISLPPEQMISNVQPVLQATIDNNSLILKVSQPNGPKRPNSLNLPNPIPKPKPETNKPPKK